jgi:hypothetical protein
VTTADPLTQLHQARVRGLVPVSALGDVTALVREALLVVTPHGAMLTAEGLARHDQLLAAWRETADLAGFTAAYERFLAVNEPVKVACSRWQAQRSDPDALATAVDTLRRIVDRVGPVLMQAGETAPRFAGYASRMENALGAGAAGDGRFLTDPRVDCVHGIWFECHEDFLTTLGRTREEEGSF